MAITTSQITITTMEGWYSGATPPLNPLIGDLWLDTTSNEIKKYDGTNWIKQADTQGPPGPQGDSIVSRVAYWIKSSTATAPEPPDPETGDMKGWAKGNEPPESALDGIGASDKFWRIYKETYSNGESEYSKYSEVELIGSYEILNGLVQFRNGVTTTENGITVIDGGKIHTKSIKADRIQVEDLEALKATIGGFHIGKNSIYSGTKQTIDSTERGIYFDSNGQSYFGDDKNFIRFYQSDKDNYKLQISADSLTFGSGISVEKSFDDIKGDIQNAQNSANNAQSAADKAKADAATALSTADTAKNSADAAQAAVEDAAKTATDYISPQSTSLANDGIKIFPKSEKNNPQNYTQINQQGMQIYKSGQKTASFGSEKISLGENSEQSIIEMCGGTTQFHTTKISDEALVTLSSTNEAYNQVNEKSSVIISTKPLDETGFAPNIMKLCDWKKYGKSFAVFDSHKRTRLGNVHSYVLSSAQAIDYNQTEQTETGRYGAYLGGLEIGAEASTIYDDTGSIASIEIYAEVDEYINSSTKGNVTTSINLNAHTVRINYQPLADFIVEQGTSGIWRYEKWASGKAVAYMPEFYVYSNLTMTASGNLYLSEDRTLNLPSGLFVDTNYIVSHEFQSAGGPVSIMRQKNSTKNKFLFKIYKVFKTNTGVSLKFSVKGRWR